MTRFIDVTNLATIISQIGIGRCLDQLMHYIEQDFKRWQEFDKSARLASHSKTGVIELMPTANTELYAFKYVNGHPKNTDRGLLTVMAFGALSEVSTGYPLFISELTLTTALRTAATSVMAARALSKRAARTMAMIGCGAQSEFQAIAFHKLLGIEEIRIYDIDPAAMQKLKSNLQEYPDLKVTPAASSSAAVRGADIVTTVTADKSRATIFTPEMLEPGMHINALGGDCPGKTEIHPEVLKRADIFVEYEPQTRIEGEIQQLACDHPVTELWRVLRGEVVGRSNAEQVTLFDSVGFALEDFSALRYIYQLALELGAGEHIELIPDLDNPKDLFSLTVQAQAQVRAPTHRVA